jgi:hypothetical protein
MQQARENVEQYRLVRAGITPPKSRAALPPGFDQRRRLSPRGGGAGGKLQGP